jgi:hypothetical protein
MFSRQTPVTPTELADAIDRSFDFLNPRVARIAGDDVLVIDLREHYRLVCMPVGREWTAQYLTVDEAGQPLPAQVPPHSLYVGTKKPLNDVLAAVLQAVIDWYRVRVEPQSNVDAAERAWVQQALRVLTP